MSEQEPHIRIHKWDELQHYKDREPPWIKLYNRLLDHYEFGRLSDAMKAHYVGLLMLRSRHGEPLPLDVDWLASRINATEPLDLEPLVDAGLIELHTNDSAPLAQEDSNVQAFARSREAETEGETEADTEGSSLRSSPSGASADSEPDPEPDQMDADQLLDAGSGAIAARYMPPTREWLFLGSDPPRKAETKAVSVYTQWLEKGYGADNLDLFPRGFRHLIDQREVVWVDVGEPCGPWAAYNQKIGAQSAFMAAVEAGRRLEGEGTPDDRVLQLAEGVSV